MEDIKNYILENFDSRFVKVDHHDKIFMITVRNSHYDKGRYPYRPQSISISHDFETGFYMSVDNFHWEFDDNEKLMIDTAKEYLDAMRNNTLKIRRRPFQKWITFGRDVMITREVE